MHIRINARSSLFSGIHQEPSQETPPQASLFREVSWERHPARSSSVLICRNSNRIWPTAGAPHGVYDCRKRAKVSAKGLYLLMVFTQTMYIETICIYFPGRTHIYINIHTANDWTGTTSNRSLVLVLSITKKKTSHIPILMNIVMNFGATLVIGWHAPERATPRGLAL